MCVDSYTAFGQEVAYVDRGMVVAAGVTVGEHVGYAAVNALKRCSAFTVFPSGTNSGRIMPLLSKNTIKSVLILDLCKLHFLGRGDPRAPFHSLPLRPRIILIAPVLVSCDDGLQKGWILVTRQ